MVYIFLFASLVLLAISRKAVRVVGSHGFYRFLAWEVILGLVILQAPSWFENPFSGRQIVSWILLILSIGIVIEGIRLLKKFGRPNEERDGADLIGIEKTTQLVTAGLYGYIRHPFYSSLLCLTWGAFFKKLTGQSLFLAGLASLLLVVTAKVEEAENLKYFGEPYRKYQERTKRFIPFVF